MIDRLLSFIAPHPCSGCGKLDSPLCNNCKYDIVLEPFEACVTCGRPAGGNGLCAVCQVPYSRAWSVGERTDTLLKLIDEYKFERVKAAHRPLVELLAARLPDLPANTIIVPIPIVNSHIRQRGYDHTLLIARKLARMKKVQIQQPLERITSAKQRGASRQERTRQAKEAFGLRHDVQAERLYLLIDDIVTTGATLKYAAKLLKDAGATDVWVAVVARHPWTK